MERIRAAYERGERDEAARLLAERIAARESQAGGHADEARMAERLGRSTLAMRAWQLVLRDQPHDVEAWRALALLHRERGDLERAARCDDRIAELTGQKAAPRPTPAPEEPAPPGPTDGELVRLVYRLGGRDGVHARMWHDARQGTGWAPVQEPLTPAVLRAHLDGSVTVGVYLVRSDDSVTAAVLDLDVTREALDRARGDGPQTEALQREVAAEGLRLRDALRAVGLDPVLVDSGYKGRHLWLFTPGPQSAASVRASLQPLLAHVAPTSPRLKLELFPKQDRVREGGLGNLVKLPFGLHKRTGRRCAVLGEDGRPAPDGIEIVLGARAVSLARIDPSAAPLPPDQAPDPVTPEPVVTPAPGWTEVDFDTSPAVSTVLSGCAVLRKLVDDTLADRRLSRDAAVVLEHSLGHLPEGPAACNYLFDHVPGFPAAERMGSPHRGSPISCSRIRKRVPSVAGRVPCECPFPDEPGQYPNPLRHLDGGIPQRRPDPTLDRLLEDWTLMADRLSRVEEEADLLRRAVVDALSAVPGRRWRVEHGTWAVEDQEGHPVLRFHPERAG